MARKTLLNESEIRRFMKLANIKPVGDQRLEEMYGVSDYKAAGKRDYEEDMDEQVEEELAAESVEDTVTELEMEDPMDEPEMDKPAEDPMDEPEMDMGADVGMKKVDIGEFFSALEAALEDTLGQEVDIEGDDLDADEGGDDEAADMMDLDLDAPEGDMDMGMDDEEPGMRDMMEARVNRIAARVAKRLVAENKKATNIDALTERIFNRLANK
tara:strand:- start:2613 stop:3251 length:639 start_codon:yes stop_codon:yes gene_type:complete